MSGELNKDEKQISSSAAEYLTYVAAIGNDEDENIWLTQKMMATLYNVSISTINEHLKKIYDDEEIYINPTIRNFLIVQKIFTNIKEQALKNLLFLYFFTKGPISYKAARFLGLCLLIFPYISI